jgi:hypothetical protein
LAVALEVLMTLVAVEVLAELLTLLDKLYQLLLLTLL